MMFQTQAPSENDQDSYSDYSDISSQISSNVSSISDRNDDTINNLTAEFRTRGYSSDEEYNSISS